MPTISNIRVGASSATNGSAPTPGLPASLAAGDIMILAFYSRDDTNGTVSLPGTWTQLVNTRSSGGLLAVYYRVWQSGDAAPTITLTNHTTGTSGESAIAQIMAYSGGNTASPWDLVGTVSTNASQQNIGAIAAAGTMGAEDMVIVVGGKRDDWTSVATLTGDGLTWNELGEPDTTSGADAGLVWNYALNPGTFLGLTDKTFTVTGGAAATGMGVMIAMNVSPNFGTSAQTMADFTSTASGDVTSTTQGTVAVTLAAFTSAASGTETFNGTSSQTLAAFTSTISASETFSGSSAQTLSAFTSNASGVENMSGSSSQTLTHFTSSASGEVVANNTEGTVDVTLADFTSNATGVETISATSSQILSGFTSTASAAQTISGSSTQALSNFTSSASGEESIVGTVSVTLQAAISTANGIETITGTLSGTLQNATSSASGSVTSSDATGTVAVTLSNFTSSVSAVETIYGTVSNTLQNATATISGTVGDSVTGTVAATLSGAVSSASGFEIITGTAAIDLGSAGTGYARILINLSNGEIMVLNGNCYVSSNGDIMLVVA